MLCLAVIKHINMYVSCCLGGKLNSRHTLRFWRISMRAAPGREAVGPVVLLGQQRRPFPVRHRSKHPQEKPLQRREVLGPPVEISWKICTGDFNTRSLSVKGFWHPHDTARRLKAEAKQQKHVSHDCDLSHTCDGQRARPMSGLGEEVGGFKETLVDRAVWRSGWAAFKY